MPGALKLVAQTNVQSVLLFYTRIKNERTLLDLLDFYNQQLFFEFSNLSIRKYLFIRITFSFPNLPKIIDIHIISE